MTCASSRPRPGVSDSLRMANYILPCSCGRQSIVSARQAGQVIQCECGATLEVPTLRHLGQLARAGESSAARAQGQWENRHRASFVLFVMAIAAFGLAAYLAFSLPPAIEPPQLLALGDDTSPAQYFQAFLELSKPWPAPIQWNTVNHRRDGMMLSMWIALGLGAALLLAAMASLAFGGRRQPARSPSARDLPAHHATQQAEPGTEP